MGLIVIFPETNLLLFQDEKGTSSLQVLAIAIFLSSIAITMSAILQGLGYFKRTAVFIGGAFLLKWMANQLLVPLWGITGSALATVLSLSLLCVAVLFELQRKLPKMKRLRNVNWIAFTIASFGMVSYLLLFSHFISYEAIASRLGLLFYVMFLAITGALIYIVLLVRCQAFSKRELMMLPFSSLFIRLHQGRDPFDS